MGSWGISKRIANIRKEKGGADGAESKKIPDRKSTSAIVTSEEELLLITEESEVHLVSDETMWVVDSGPSIPSDPRSKCFSSYTTRDHNFLKMGNEGAC